MAPLPTPELSGDAPSLARRWLEIFLTFLRLGCTAFGGPVAHLAYFHETLVKRRGWITDAAYADLVALCQFLPGPASSKVGFLLGVLRGGGLMGGWLAWLGFTLPSAVIMVGAAWFAASLDPSSIGGVLHGLKLVAVPVVAHAVGAMAIRLTPDGPRVGIAMGAATLALALGGSLGQIGAIIIGALAGILLCRGEGGDEAHPLPMIPIRRRAGAVALGLFVVLLVGLPLWSAMTGSPFAGLADAFYRAGALVFGGGHVLLPLLQAEVVDPGWVSSDAFLAGYGVAQALPGPLFTLAAYLGMLKATAPNGLIGAIVALVAVFLPGGLLAYGALPFWVRLRGIASMRRLMRGANAAVVGILAAALIDPVCTKAIHSPLDVIVALGALGLLVYGRVPAWGLVVLAALGYGLAG